MIKDINQLDFKKRYTYADYLTWQFDEMVELIKGKIYKMSPAPGRRHQEVAGNLHLVIGNFLKKKPCQVFFAPFDVRLPLPPDQVTEDKINTVVQPDISVICDLNKLDDKGCNGAPDWIIEILSPGTSKKDYNEKFDLYQHAGVKEYWIVHPIDETVFAYTLNVEGNYENVHVKPFVKGERIESYVLEGLEINLEEIF